MVPELLLTQDPRDRASEFILKLICLLRLRRKVYTFSSQPVCIFGLCLCTYFLLACDWPVELFTMGGQVCACICMLQLDRLILLPCWY